MQIFFIMVALVILCPLVAVMLFPAPDVEMKSDEYDIHAMDNDREFMEAIDSQFL